MEANVLIPNPIFKETQQLAKKLGISMNELYTTALASFIAQHKKDYITDKLNTVYQEESSSIDKELVEIQLFSIEKDAW